jgi:murein DD-endopeptidase MepM/ murein hydrolase activator NlpD
MSCVVVPPRSRLWPRVATLALIVISLAGCSSDSTRLNDMNGYGSWGGEPTGSAPPASAAPAGRVESRPLPPQQYSQAPQPAAAPLGGSSAGVSGGSRGIASYTPAAQSASPMPPPATSDVTGSVVQRPASGANWTWDGGTPITVAQGDTVEIIARRYGVPASAIIQANNISQPGSLHPGQQLVIPRYAQSSAAMPPASRLAARSAQPHVAAAKPANAASPVGNAGVHIVAAGENLTKISRLYGKSVSEIAKANNIQVTARLNVGDRLVIPGVRVSALKPKAAALTPAAPTSQAKPVVVASAAKETEPAISASVFAPTADAPSDAVKGAEAAGGLPKFRWPANGRVITGFGPSTNGQQNDGINIALPENTQIKAAEDGVVAYAGNELKGYGNLVLVRHPNGYVTAYAHAKELLVKRGDQVKRGQPIARSGQTGNVNAPQLHFEIRKGASPLDPMKFLNGA